MIKSFHYAAAMTQIVGVYLAATTQQLIVDGKPRHPLGLPTFLGSSHRQQSYQVSRCLITVESDARQVHLTAGLRHWLRGKVVVDVALDCTANSASVEC